MANPSIPGQPNSGEEYQPRQFVKPKKPPFPKPDNYLIWSVLAMLLCCQPLGVISLVYATQVDSKWSAGNYSGAVEASGKAKSWAWASFGLGIALYAVLLPMYILMIALSQ